MSESTIKNPEEFRKSIAVDGKKQKKPRLHPNIFIPKDPHFFEKNDNRRIKEIYTDSIRD